MTPIEAIYAGKDDVDHSTNNIQGRLIGVGLLRPGQRLTTRGGETATFKGDEVSDMVVGEDNGGTLNGEKLPVGEARLGNVPGVVYLGK